MGILTSGRFITSCEGEVLPLLSFLGKVFGELKLLGVFPFSFGLLLGIGLGGFDFVDWCIMCCCCGEMVDYLPLHCEKAYRLWSFVLHLLEFRGSYLERFHICFLVGGIGWGSTRLTSRI